MATAINFLPLPTSQQFLLDQLAHAEGHIRLLTRHMQTLRDNLMRTGKSELEADAQLAESSKPWKQFRKDFAFYHTLWNRMTRLLALFRKPASAPAAEPVPPQPKQPEPAKQMPIRVNKTGRNEPCPCGSGKKFKFCCIDKRPAPLAA